MIYYNCKEKGTPKGKRKEESKMMYKVMMKVNVPMVDYLVNVEMIVKADRPSDAMAMCAFKQYLEGGGSVIDAVVEKIV